MESNKEESTWGSSSWGLGIPPFIHPVWLSFQIGGQELFLSCHTVLVTKACCKPSIKGVGVFPPHWTCTACPDGWDASCRESRLCTSVEPARGTKRDEACGRTAKLNKQMGMLKARKTAQPGVPQYQWDPSSPNSSSLLSSEASKTDYSGLRTMHKKLRTLHIQQHWAVKSIHHILLNHTLCSTQIHNHSLQHQ